VAQVIELWEDGAGNQPATFTARIRSADRCAGRRGHLSVELAIKDRATVEAFEAGIAALDEVVECRRMFGLPDYVVRVAVADQAAYEAF
jgi:DNA-binding Lrp family transcriptional regulator